MVRFIPFIALLVVGCGSSAAPTPTPTPAATAVATALPTPVQNQLQTLVDQGGKGTKGNLSDNYIFTVPRGYYRLQWQFHCPSSYSASPNNFVIFSSLKKGAPLADPGELMHAGSGTIAESTASGTRVVVSIIAYGKCQYHIHVVG